ncbi:CoA transferase, partial [Streptomyces sp. NPDC055078]
ALHGVGMANQRPVPPMVLAGDTGGGGVFLALGICAALVERTRSGRGQVVDAAIVDGAAALMSPIYGAYEAGAWTDDRGSNRIDGGASYYRTYECADGKYVAVGAIEEPFFASLVDLAGLEPQAFAGRLDPTLWAEHSEHLERVFKQRSRDEWCALLEGTDACVTPVLSLAEAKEHPHNRHRQLFVDMGETPVPAPAPRFERTPSRITRLPVEPGTDTESVLQDFGHSPEHIRELLDGGVVMEQS